MKGIILISCSIFCLIIIAIVIGVLFLSKSIPIKNYIYKWINYIFQWIQLLLHPLDFLGKPTDQKPCDQKYDDSLGSCWSKPGYGQHIKDPPILKPCSDKGNNLNDVAGSCWATQTDRGVGKIPDMKCPNGKVQRGLLCFDPPPNDNEWTSDYTWGKKCPENTRGDIATCWYDRGVGQIPAMKCPNGKVQRGLLCVDPPPNDKEWTADYTWGKKCPDNTRGDIATCWYNRDTGQIPAMKCPNGKVQRGLLCVDSPPNDKEWTADYTWGKKCPDNTRGDIATCWYDRGAGQIPKKRPCGDGERDDQISCWKDSYGRGAGRIPDYDGCGDDYNTFPLTCTRKGCGGHHNLSWGSINCNGPKQRETHAPGWLGGGRTGWDDCYDTFISVCWNDNNGGHGIDTYNRTAKCHDDEEMYGELCYPKCKSGFHNEGCCICAPDGHVGGYITKSLSDRQYCDGDHPKMESGLCYPDTKPGFGCTATTCSMNRDPHTVVGKPMDQYCSDTSRKIEAGLCYPDTKPGFGCTATTCSMNRDPHTVVGTPMDQYCSDTSRHIEGGLCYPDTKPGFGCAATTCSMNRDPHTIVGTPMDQYCSDSDRHMEDGLCYKKCPEGQHGVATMCIPDGNDDVSGLPCVGSCIKYALDHRKYCPENQHMDGLHAFCYDNCNPGWHSDGALMCIKDENVLNSIVPEIKVDPISRSYCKDENFKLGPLNALCYPKIPEMPKYNKDDTELVKTTFQKS